MFNEVEAKNLEYDVTDVSCPMFLVHGGNDKMFLPDKHFRKIIAEMDGKDNFEYWLVPDSKHTRMDQHKDYKDKVTEFIRKHE